MGYKDALPNPHLANQAAKAYTSLFAFTLSVLRSFVSSAINLLTRCRIRFNPINKHTRMEESMLIGGVAGIEASSIISPINSSRC